MAHGTPVKNHSNRSSQTDFLAEEHYEALAKLGPKEAHPTFMLEVKSGLENSAAHINFNYDRTVEELLLAARTPTGNGGDGHRDIVQLLNTISYHLVKILNPQATARSEAIIFVSAPNHTIPEDDMKTDIKPDWYAYMTTYEVLEKTVIVDNPCKPLVGSYYTLIGVGEQVSGGSNPTGKMMHYLEVLCRYRYDLKTVYAFQYMDTSKEGRHWSFNACGWAHSDTVACNPHPTPGRARKDVKGKKPRLAQEEDPLLPWVEHVLCLYLCNSSRIGRITRGNHVGVNIWTVGEKTFVVIPFHASHGPGRMTTVFLLLWDLMVETIGGVIKRQFRDLRGQFVEGDLLEKIKLKYWFPCFPFLEYMTRYPQDKISQWGSSIEGEFNLLEIRSTGHSLVSCADSNELLMTAYDAILAHWLLYEKCGILHRDVSFNNVFCQPKHHLTAVQRQNLSNMMQNFRKPIKEVLGESEGEWSALLADFDQAVDYADWHGKAENRRLERTGTPMFIAIEKSLTEKVAFDERQYHHLLELSEALMYAEKHHPNEFHLAFPSSEANVAFNANWDKVLHEERDRALLLVTDPDLSKSKYKTEFLDPSREHSAYHDVESFYWVFLWAFTRALPEGSVSDQRKYYKEFCCVMLSHTVQDELDSRIPYLYHLRQNMPGILHPKLERFTKLFLNMAEYLSIPWLRFEGLELPDDHAHQAMLRLLLGAILKERNTPTPLSCKIRYYKSKIKTKAVKAVSKYHSMPRSIPSSQNVSLGSIPETSSSGLSEGNEHQQVVVDEAIVASTANPSAALNQTENNDVVNEKILEPLPNEPRQFMDRVPDFKLVYGNGITDQVVGNIIKTGHQQNPSSKNPVHKKQRTK